MPQTAPAPVERIVIVGGGTAGWMCASGLARVVPPTVKVVLVESEEIGTVGVGEATIPTLTTFNNFLGIEDAELIRETGGTFKLGIEFVDWLRLGQSYFHPFGTIGLDTVEFKFHLMWLRLLHAAKTDTGLRARIGDLEDYSLSAAAARRGRFAVATENEQGLLGTIRHAFHFDAALYASMLRGYAERRGVERIEGRVVECRRHASSGLVEAVVLDGGRVVAGDLFVDCSGFRGLLIAESLAVPYEDWSTFLPCDRAIAVPTAADPDPAPFTRSIAVETGWRWRIPLRHRTGNGQVYASAYVDDSVAEEQLLAALGAEPLGEPRRLRFRTGHRRRFWEGNCVAIGLSAGFIEPLESTSIHLIQMGVARLIEFFPDRAFSPADVAEYNRLMQADYEHVRDFIVLHYKASERDDSAFWRHCRNMPIPDTLAQRMDLFRSRGRVARREEDLFKEDSWLAVMIGQGVLPSAYDPLVDRYPMEQLTAQMERLRAGVGATADRLAPHRDHLRRIVGGAAMPPA